MTRAFYRDFLGYEGVSLETAGVNAIREYLFSGGVAVPRTVDRDARKSVLNGMDPEGHTVEFVQYRPGSLLAKSKGNHVKSYTDVLGFREFWQGSSTGTELSWST